MKFVRLPGHVKNIHYAWVMLAIAIAMRLVSSVERTASGVLVAYMVDPTGEFGWSRSMVGLALSLQWICSGIFGPPAGWLGDRYGLRLAMAVGALVVLPAGVFQAQSAVIRPDLLGTAFVVALLSSVLPYSLDLEALRRLPEAVFGVLMSLDPAVAALIGFVVLDQVMGGRELLAIAMVVVASAGSAGLSHRDT